MQFTTLTTLLPFLTLALADKKVIDVGQHGLKFTPDSVTAAEGDELEFHFYPQAHNVAQSTFDKPCIATQNGIWSDFIPVPQGEANRTFTVTVNDTKPLWFYCSQGQHCQNGMAMVVNPPSSGGNTLEAYVSAARDVAKATSPESGARGGVIAATSASNSSSNATESTSSSAASSGTATSSASGTATSSASGTGAAAATPTGAAMRLEAAGLGVLGLAGLVVAGMV